MMMSDTCYETNHTFLPCTWKLAVYVKGLRLPDALLRIKRKPGNPVTSILLRSERPHLASASIQTTHTRCTTSTSRLHQRVYTVRVCNNVYTTVPKSLCPSSTAKKQRAAKSGRLIKDFTTSMATKLQRYKFFGFAPSITTEYLPTNSLTSNC
jgi:hypothetical protein